MDKRLTTENPVGNMGYILNFTKVIDGEVYIRDSQDEEDISLVDYCKKEYKEMYGEDTKDSVTEATAEDFGEYMDDDSLLSMFYWMAVGHAELRFRLSQYEDTGLSPEEIASNIKMDCKGEG